MNLRKNDLLKFAHAVLVAETKMARVAEKQEKSFEETIKGQKFKHPDTKNDVTFGSLPAEEQKKIRGEFDKANPKEEISEKDQKALDALDGLDLDSEDLAKMLEEVSKELEDFELTDEDMKELGGMSKDDLLGQAEALLKNNEGAGEALSKAVDNNDDDDDDDDDDYEDGVDRVLNKEVKLDKKSEAHFNEIENLIISEAIDEDTLKSIVENMVENARGDDFEDLLDVGFEDFDADDLTKIMKAVFSKDKDLAGALNDDLRRLVIDNVIESDDYITDEGLSEEISNLMGEKLMGALEEADFSDLSLDDLNEAEKKYNEAKQLHKDKFNEVKKSLDEKFGGDEELIDEALTKLGFEPDTDLDDEDQMQVMLEDYGIPPLGDDFKSALKKKKAEEKDKANKAKADKAKADKAKADKSKADKAKADKSKAKAENKNLAKDKKYRDEAKQKSLKGLDSIVEDLNDVGLGYYSYAMKVDEAFESLYSDFGIEPGDDLSDLDDDVLNDFIESVEAVDKDLTEKMNNQEKELRKKRDESEKELKKNKARLKELGPKIDKLENMTWEKWDALEEKDPKKFKKLNEEWDELDKEISQLRDANEEHEWTLGLADQDLIGSAVSTYDDNPEGNSVNEMLAKAQGVAGNRKEQKKIEEAKKKEEEEHKQKVKEYTKKINDLISKAEKSKDTKDVSDLFGEFGRMKGQLTGGKVFDEVKGDLDKAEKALKDSQERNSFGGKLKSFFGLSKGKKKASQAQKDKVAKIALEMLKEEIALYKEEESKRKR